MIKQKNRSDPFTVLPAILPKSAGTGSCNNRRNPREDKRYREMDGWVDLYGAFLNAQRRFANNVCAQTNREAKGS